MAYHYPQIRKGQAIKEMIGRQGLDMAEWRAGKGLGGHAWERRGAEKRCGGDWDEWILIWYDCQPPWFFYQQSTTNRRKIITAYIITYYV